MTDISQVILDPELGSVSFHVRRYTYTVSRGTTTKTEQSFSAAGCIHPGTPETVELLPEEERHKIFIVIYTTFALSLGENPGGITYTAADRILVGGRMWKLVRLRDWSAFGYRQGLAVLTEGEDE